MTGQASATPTAGRGSERRISGYVLKVIRESVGQTQEQLAERLRVSAATIQGWESGRRPPMAVSTGNLMVLRAELRRFGAAPALLGALAQGLEADLFVGDVLATSHDQARSDGYLLGGWVVTRPFTEMTAWPIGGTAPHAVASSTRQALRHGPVPPGQRSASTSECTSSRTCRRSPSAPTGGQRRAFCSPARPTTSSVSTPRQRQWPGSPDVPDRPTVCPAGSWLVAELAPGPLDRERADPLW